MSKKIINTAGNGASPESPAEFSAEWMQATAARLADLSDQRKADQSAKAASAKAKPNILPAVHSPKVVEAFLLAEQEAKEAGAVGLMARALIMATMPHRKTDDHEFIRKNGNFMFGMWSMHGLPYGALPRLIMSFFTTEAKRTMERTLILGESMSDMMKSLGLERTGGPRGGITRFKDQMERLLACAVTCSYEDGKNITVKHLNPVETASLWWNPRKPEELSEWQSTITLSENFFREITDRPVPLRMVSVEALKGSSLALDIYFWLTYRNSYASRPSRIPWEALQAQFGAGYPTTSRGKADFKLNFLKALKLVGKVYPEALKLKHDTDALIFIPGKPDVPPLPRGKKPR